MADETTTEPVTEAARETADIGRLSASDVLGVISIFERMLLAMEARLVAKMDDNNRLAAERWAQHDAQALLHDQRLVARFESIESRYNERFLSLEKSLLTTSTTLETHLKGHEREDIESAARIKPIKGVIGWLWENWRDVVIVVIALAALLTAWGDSIAKLFGAPAT